MYFTEVTNSVEVISCNEVICFKLRTDNRYTVKWAMEVYCFSDGMCKMYRLIVEYADWVISFMEAWMKTVLILIEDKEKSLYW